MTIAQPKGDSTPVADQITLKPTFTVDVAVKGASGEVVIAGAAAEDVVEGIYDYLDTQNPIRSGRFNIKLKDHNEDPVDPTVPHKIIVLKGGNLTAWYRIFNSGDNSIILERGSLPPETIKPDQSFDFAVGSSSQTITVKSTAAELPIEGIYEFLGKG